MLFLVWGFAGALASNSEGLPQLVHDFFPGEFEADFFPTQPTRLGDALFFVARDVDQPSRVWRTDGTPAGTQPVHGANGDYLQILGTVERYILWTEGTAEAPDSVVLVSAAERGDGIALRTYRRDFEEPLAITSQRFFFQDCTAKCAVWETDGTVSGTRPIGTLAARFPPGSLKIVGTFADRWLILRSGPSLFAYDFLKDQVLLLLPDYARTAEMRPAGNTLYFSTRHGTYEEYRMRLWASRLGSPRAVQLFEDPRIGISGWRGNLLYFAQENGRLWSTDGRRENTRPYSGLRVETFSIVADQLGSIGSTTFLPMPGYYWGGLLAADENKREVRQLRTLCRGKHDCRGLTMSGVTVAGGLGFEAVRGKLWQSDGTREGTKAHEILSQVDVSSFRALDGRLLVGATSRQGEEQLWATDGTASGTRALSDGTPDRPFRVQGPPVPLGGALVVLADHKPLGRQLWRVEDGRTTALTEVRHLATGINPYAAFPLGGRVVIYGERSNNSWLSLAEDGSAEPLPELYIDEQCPFDGLCSAPATVVGGRLVFAMYSQSALGFTDGTAAGTGTVPLQDGQGYDSAVHALGRLGDQLVVLGGMGGLWSTDGTVLGTRFITQLPDNFRRLDSWQPVGPPVSSGPLAFFFIRVKVPGRPPRENLEIWRTDGTPAGTLRLASTPFPEDFAPFLSPAVVGGRLFFRFGGTLWMSDGSAEGTHPLRDQLPGGTFALAAGAETLYAGAGYQDEDGKQMLWAVDPTTLSATLTGSFNRVADGHAGTILGSIVGNSLFFWAADDSEVDRGWITDGTSAGTHPVRGLPVRNRTSDPVSAGDRFYLNVCKAQSGCELWSTDRLGEDTRIVQDLWPGRQGSHPWILNVSADALWFAATEPSTGREIWKIDLSSI